VLAQEEARLLNHNYIGTEHILLGLIHEGEGVAAKALESLGISLEAVRQQVEEIIGQGGSSPSGHIPFTPRAKKVLELSLREALQLGHNYIGTEHILLGLIREGEGVAAQVLVKLGADLNRSASRSSSSCRATSGYQGKAGRAGVGRRPAAGGTPSGSLVLDQFGRNLTQLREGKKLDPVIGREKEIERVMQVLSRRTKNNPVLIGEPGVGKTAIVEGLAQDIAATTCPRPSRTSSSTRSTSAPWWPGPATAATSRSGSRRSSRRSAPAATSSCSSTRSTPSSAPVPPRAPSTRPHPQADAGPRRAADHRCHHPRRVPQAPREGRRAGAPLPADPGGGADRGPHHRDPQGPARPLRAAPPGHHHRPGAGRGGQPGRPLHLRPFLPDKAIDLIDEAGSRLRIRA
jgi:hypothetical protein